MIDRLFFVSGNGYVLGFCRLLYFSLFLLGISDYRPELYGFGTVTSYGAPVELWTPHSFFGLLGLTPLSYPELLKLTWLWKASLLLAAVGLWTRASTWVAFVLGLYLMGVHVGYIENLFSLWLPTVVLGVLAFSDCGHYFSIDHWWSVRQGRRPSDQDYRSPRYGWPLRLVLLLVLLMYFNAGVAKLRHAGPEWPHYLQGYMHYTDFYLGPYAADWQRALRDALVARPSLLFYGGWLVLILELLAPLAFFVRRLEAVFLPPLFLITLGFYAFMYVYTIQRIAGLYLFFIPWERLYHRMRKPISEDASR